MTTEKVIMCSNRDYLLKFIHYLYSLDVMVDDSIEKEEARIIYNFSFKAAFPRVKFPFSKMYTLLQLNYFTTRNKDLLILRPEVIKGQKISTERKVSSNLRMICNICQVSSYDEKSHVEHCKTERHLLLNKYINNRKSLTNTIAGLKIVVQDNRNNSEEVCIMQVREQRELCLRLVNNSGSDYYVTKMIEITPNNDVTIQKHDHLNLVNGTQLVFKINVHFNNTVYFEYPLLFQLKNLDSTVITEVLKVLIFYAYSNVLDDLHPTTSYQKIKSFQKVSPIFNVIRGEHVKRGISDFVPAIPLQQYKLSDNLIEIFNHGLKEFEGMSHHQKLISRGIRNTLHDFKFKHNGTLNELNYFEMLKLLLQMEEHQLKVDVNKYSLDGATLLKVKGYSRNCLELKVPEVAEHRPSLLRGDSVFINEDGSTVTYEGIVHKVVADGVILGFSLKFMDTVHLDNKKYKVKFGFNRIPLRAEHQAITLANEHRIITLLCKSTFLTSTSKSHQLVWFNRNINNNLQQQQAVKNILSQTSRPLPYLIFGPPGTGKTVTVVEAVLQIWKLFPTKHILVSTPSNIAADEITKRLITVVPNRDLLRYIAPSYPYDLVFEEVKPFVNYQGEDYYHPPNSTVLTYRIVVTTLVAASRLINGGTPGGHFDYVFIDESGQATESETLIPIAGILSSSATKGVVTGQVILAGDPKQLGPIIHSMQAQTYGFDIAMLERLMKNNSIYHKNEKGVYNEEALTKLVQSYRSHPAILEVPNKLFYDGELVASANQQMTHIAIGWEHLPNGDFPVIFYSVIGKDEREQNSPSFFNIQEIDVILNYLSLLIGNKLCGIKIMEQHIGIIAPYRKQVYKLKQACKKQGYSENLFIGSVEQFQGQERLIILLSTVRCRPEYTTYDSKFHLGFLANPKRFNVGLTRAKALLIVVGNPKILLLDPNWRAFIKHCKDNKSNKGAPFNMEPDVSDLAENLNSLKLNDTELPVDIEEDPNFARGRI